MAYNRVVSFDTLYFELSDIKVRSQDPTRKTKFGKTFSESPIPLRDARDTVLEVTGLLTGLSRTSGQTVATAISNDRTTLEALENGDKYDYNDGLHNSEFAIVTGSLSFNDSPNRSQGEPLEFTMTLKEWEGS